MTYSIVARDPETGALGVGVETHQPSVGAIVPWVRPGVGAVATQSFVNIAFGPQGLALLESGLSPERAMAAIIAGDDMPGRRQVAILSAGGEVAVHTGESCIPFAGHRIGEGYSVQANMMARDTVPDAMAEAFEGATGHLAQRILAALDAAQAEGGDIRGSQSAAILVRAPGHYLDFHWDLRVDNDPKPLVKLHDLVNIRLAGRVLERVTESGSALAEDRGERLRLFEAAFERADRLAPHDEQTFWYAVTGLAQTLGENERAMDLLDGVFARAPQWRELLMRLELPGLEGLKAALREQ
ncbi:MAG: DUF1028 domain-containing protein [Dehalococcoidia bacterium]